MKSEIETRFIAVDNMVYQKQLPPSFLVIIGVAGGVVKYSQRELSKSSFIL